jgi:hypothetical protein
MYRHRVLGVYPRLRQPLLFMENGIDEEKVPENLSLCRYQSSDYHRGKISQYPIHNISHAEKLLKQCHRTRKSDLYVMEKGYDSDDIHELIRDMMNPCSLIPFRTRKRKRINGYYRWRLSQSFDSGLCHKRNMVESVFLVHEINLGSPLKPERSGSRSGRSQSR